MSFSSFIDQKMHQYLEQVDHGGNLAAQRDYVLYAARALGESAVAAPWIYILKPFATPSE